MYRILMIFLILLSILCTAPTNLNRARIIEHHAGDWNYNDYSSRVDALPTTENIIAIGDSGFQRYWATYKAGGIGACALKINNQIDNQSANSVLLNIAIRNQYRDGCCSGGNDCATSNSCTYDWIILDGGGNDFVLNLGCYPSYASTVCGDDAQCQTELDGLLDYNSGTDTWTGTLYDILTDISYQGSGDKNVVYMCYWDIETLAYRRYQECEEELCALAKNLADNHSDDWPSGVSFYVAELIDTYKITFSNYPDYYDDDGAHLLFYGTTVYGNAIATVVNAH